MRCRRGFDPSRPSCPLRDVGLYETAPAQQVDQIPRLRKPIHDRSSHPPFASAPQTTEHFDVLIVGAGISGIGSAYHLTMQLPGTSFVMLETQESFGGTWLTHRYPGIRSDSDLHTFGYRFKPWTGAPIATAAEIRAYMGEVIAENGLGRHIRYRHRISSAAGRARRISGPSKPIRPTAAKP